MKVGAVIGQASSPGWLVSEMPKPGAAFQSAPAAAAWKVLASGATNLPSLFWICANGMLFCLA